MKDSVNEVFKDIQETVEFFEIEISDVNQRGICGNTPLKIAVVWNDNNAVRLLLNAGADPNLNLENGFTALHHASASNNAEICNLLIEHGSLIGALNNEGRTPYDIAKSLGNTNVLNLLDPIARRMR